MVTERPGAVGVETRFESHRVELTAYCYRMLGSGFEAEDAVQETLIRAWRGFERFEGRSTLRAWLYSIATNVCLNMLKGAQRRARPMDLGPAGTGDAPLGPALTERVWVGPVPDRRALPADGDPAELAVARESIRLAFVAALQLLPPRQRAVLILRDVLRWSAADVAGLLEISVVSVKSALQRARATLATSGHASPGPDALPAAPLDDEHLALLDRYVEALERWDIDGFVALLHEDAIVAMPPHPLWLQGAGDIHRWFQGTSSRIRTLRTAANGSPAVGLYRAERPGGPYDAFDLQVIELSGGRITAIHCYLDSTLFPLFDLPTRWTRGRADPSPEPE
ncbi:MAG TPA: sigma-70 family RNA polymerase sigma factor [Acidimicrobiales bacterium]|nr:sigma-70 family RNA polymerase sigma factor [Acidimicrobiales bacterium]